MKHGTHNLPKFIRLKRLVQQPRCTVQGMLDGMWEYASQVHPDGDLGINPADDLADVVEWPGDARKLLAALIETSWMDVAPRAHGVHTNSPSVHTHLIHDWPDHCEDAVHMRLARAHKFFANGKSPKLCRISGAERKQLEEWYASHSPPTVCTDSQAVHTNSPSVHTPCTQVHTTCIKNAIPCTPPPPPPPPLKEKESGQEPDAPAATNLSGGEGESALNEYGSLFLGFWELWPRGSRKTNKAGCWQLWQDRDYDSRAAEIIAALERDKARNPNWLEDGGKFIPCPVTWLKEERFGADCQPPAAGSSMTPTEQGMAAISARLFRHEREPNVPPPPKPYARPPVAAVHALPCIPPPARAVPVSGLEPMPPTPALAASAPLPPHLDDPPAPPLQDDQAASYVNLDEIGGQA